MSRKGHLLQFAWRDGDSAWRAERTNDRVVFRKIRHEKLKGRKIATVIRQLFGNPFWASRMSGKSAESWRVNYYRWVREKCSDVQAKKHAPEPCNHWVPQEDKSFFGESVKSYSRPYGRG